MHMMAPPLRERVRRGHRTYEEEFVLYLQGIPTHCRWQELKDFVRQTALHIRQAVVYDDEHGYPTGLGQIIVKNEDEAWRTFRKLAASGWDGQPLTVTLARASSPTRPIAGPTQSPAATVPATGYAGKFPRHAVSATPAPESPITTESLRAPSITATTAFPPFIPASPYPINHGHTHQSFPTLESGFPSPTWNPHPEMLMGAFPSTADLYEYPYYFPYSLPVPVPMPQPVYMENGHDYQHYFSSFAPQHSRSTFIAANPYHHHGYQVYGYDAHKLDGSSSMFQCEPTSYNTSIPPQRAISMQGTCHIIIDNICLDVDAQALKDHFRGAGHMKHCQIIRYNTDENGGSYNKHSYPGQCYATASFSSPEEAEKAVTMYNGSDIAGSRVVVRLDSEWHASTNDSPTVAGGDGSGDSDWSRSLSLTTSSTIPLRSSMSESRNGSMGAFSAYSESSSSQLSGSVSQNQHNYQHHRHRRDSGKELLKSMATNDAQSGKTEKYDDDDAKTPNQQTISSCVIIPHSRSVSPKSVAKSGEIEGSVIQQPLVVNGSVLGRPKM